MINPETIRAEIDSGGGLSVARLLREMGGFAHNDRAFRSGQIDELMIAVGKSERIFRDGEDTAVSTHVEFFVKRDRDFDGKRHDKSYDLSFAVTQHGIEIPPWIAKVETGCDDPYEAVDMVSPGDVKREVALSLSTGNPQVESYESYTFYDRAGDEIWEASISNQPDINDDEEDYGSHDEEDYCEDEEPYDYVGRTNAVRNGEHDRLVVPTIEDAIRWWGAAQQSLDELESYYRERNDRENLLAAFMIFYGLKATLRQQLGL